MTFTEAIAVIEQHFPNSDDTAKLYMVGELLNANRKKQASRLAEAKVVKEQLTHLCSNNNYCNTDTVCDLPVYRLQLIREKTLSIDANCISSPRDAADIFRRYLSGLDREHAVELLLDIKNRVIGIHTISIGDLSSAIVGAKEVLRAAILSCAAGIILGHNHPSGCTDPSSDDISLTRRISGACEIMGIDLLDHIVIGDNHSFISLKEKGLF